MATDKPEDILCIGGILHLKTRPFTSGDLSYQDINNITSANSCEDDAAKWAKSFIETCNANELTREQILDKGFMIGWFANAIEISNDHRQRLRLDDLHELAEEIENS